VKVHLKGSVFVIVLLILASSCTLSVSEVLAHAPLATGGNENLATATLIPDPAKSWAIYGELHEGREAQYYSFNINEGQKIRVMLFKSTRPEDKEFLPGFVLMGHEINEQGDIPDYVQKPLGAKALVVKGVQPAQATFEPFSPSSFYSLAETNLNAPTSGTYYLAVYEPSKGGHYGLAIGDRESYTLTEWILIPLNLLSIYQWEGQNLAVIFTPMILTLTIGFALILKQSKTEKKPKTVSGWLGASAGLLFISTSTTTLFQLAFSLTQAPLGSEVAVTLILALIPTLLGIAALRLSLTGEKKTNLKKRVYLAILGVAALFAWAGLLIGPVLAIIASILPS